MILASFALALGQMGDPAFRRVLWRGVAWAALALVAASALLLWGAQALLPDVVTLPWIGTVGWLDDALGWALVPAALVLSVFLMIPVASAVCSMFLDEVADAVEGRHYPRLTPARPMPWAEALRDSVRFLGVILLANAAAFALYLALPPLAPVVFVAVNGALLGREYVMLATLRRMGRPEARAFARRHAPTIWLAGCLMALPLTIPVLNLLVPVLGAATFTHLVQRLR